MRVLVTRPEPGASSTADRLRAMGHEPVLMPMTRLIDIPADLSGLADAAAFAVTSASALRSWRSRGIEADCLQRPLYAVGARTAAVARDCGFRNVSAGGGDGSDLADLVLGELDSGRLTLTEKRPMVYLAGAVRHGDFESRLLGKNVPLKTIEIYKIEKISYSTDSFLEAISANESATVLLYSRVAAECFFGLYNESNISNALKNISFICMSNNVLGAVPEKLRSATVVSAEPNEESLLALLGSSDKLF